MTDWIAGFGLFLVRQSCYQVCFEDVSGIDSYLAALKYLHTCSLAKGQLISKANCEAVNSSKKQTNEFIFTTIRRIFVRFLEEIEVTKKTFRN